MKQSTLRLALGTSLLALSPFAAAQTTTVTPAETQLMAHVSRLTQLGEAEGAKEADVAATRPLLESWLRAGTGEPTEVVEHLSERLFRALGDLTERARRTQLQNEDIQRFNERLVNARLERTLNQISREARSRGVSRETFNRVRQLLVERARASAAVDPLSESLRERLTRALTELETAAQRQSLDADTIGTFEFLFTDARTTRALADAERLALASRANAVEFERVTGLVQHLGKTAKLQGESKTEAKKVETDIVKALASISAKTTPSKRPTASTPGEFENVHRLVRRYRALLHTAHGVQPVDAGSPIGTGGGTPNQRETAIPIPSIWARPPPGAAPFCWQLLSSRPPRPISRHRARFASEGMNAHLLMA